ncbi:MAG: hypothetical protein EP330_02270 [Deltaproteobacteria bacterium]|nr:MAG: hypothetical protein EP330_02270 [Deltaproteobacteria bacterium]
MPTITLDWVDIPGGSFLMGSESPEGESREWPAHTVDVPAFQMARTEITAGEYYACWEAGACTPLPEGGHCYWKDSQFHDFAATCVNWYQARDFCRWAGGRLPSEAEWEYTARSAGKDYEYTWGNSPEPSCTHVVMDENGQIGCGVGTANPPCSKPDGNTEQGICDMAGNVFEWNADWYNLNVGYSDHTSSAEPFQGGNQEYRVMRGGAIGSGEPFRTRSRTYHPEDFWYGGMGGRCARDLPTP